LIQPLAVLSIVLGPVARVRAPLSAAGDGAARDNPVQ
jgi:hypothetical protein